MNDKKLTYKDIINEHLENIEKTKSIEDLNYNFCEIITYLDNYRHEKSEKIMKWHKKEYKF